MPPLLRMRIGAHEASLASVAHRALATARADMGAAMIWPVEMKLLAACLAAFLLSCGLTLLLRRYALRRRLVDIPNDRSSHTAPTPRGGGVAIVLAFFVATALFLLNAQSGIPAGALLAPGALIALVGFLDDHGHIRAGWRLLVHFCAAAWALVWIGGLPSVPFLGEMVDWGVLGNVLAAVYLVWLLNLYNFMDGIDGIAGAEAVSTAGLGAFLMWWSAGDIELAGWFLTLAVAAGGFLVWNLPPARIFMGDAGSSFLGFTLGVFSLVSAWRDPQLFWPWVILLGVFIVDASMTLFRRMARRERLDEAHRSHAYQYASRVFGSHGRVTMAVCLINLFWLFPWAWAVAAQWVDGFVAVVLSYLPLIGLAWQFHAGACERQADGMGR